MTKALYFECSCGISGDMIVASLISLGADRDKLIRSLESLKKLSISGFDISISDVVKSGIKAVDFNVILDEDHDGHDHDMNYLHGHEDSEHHNAAHDHGHGHHHHDHRGINEIKEIIDASSISLSAKDTAINVFEIIARAESEAHGVDIGNVHFHEVGAVDSIVDIISASVLLDDLKVDNIIIPSLTEGSGTIRCQHGILPVPVPAVVNIARNEGLVLEMSGVKGELVTPTGAAFAAAVRTSDKLPDGFKVLRCGIGAGKRTYELPSLLRVYEIEYDEDHGNDHVIRLETDIDDSCGEDLGHVMEKLYLEGAREVHFIPVYMKKNRPGTEMVVICDEDKADIMENILFEETTTIGIRRMKMDRTVLKRFFETVPTKYGIIEAKLVVLPSGKVRKYPEYESMRKLSVEKGIPLKDIRNEFNKVAFER